MSAGMSTPIRYLVKRQSMHVIDPRSSIFVPYWDLTTSLALVSFSLCYAAINAGVDVSALLQARGMAHARAPRRVTTHFASAAAQKVGIEVSSTSEKVGTVGLAYAVHKAASPIRFPPTVALTPVVARTLFGKKDDDDASADEAAE